MSHETARDNSSAALLRLTNGYQASQAIHVAAVLGIADLLGDGSRNAETLAQATNTDPNSLYRLLRALAGIGVLHEEPDRRFGLTALGENLRSDAEAPMGPWAALIGEPYIWEAWGNLLHSVRTGENAFRHLHGESVWEYRTRQPEASAVFDRAMTGMSQRTARAAIAAYDFSRFGCVVDVAGGQGALLALMLAAHPHTQGVLFDQPHVVVGSTEVLGAAGVSERCRVEAGSFFDAVPEGGDAYVLKAILHDWEDAECAAILRACRRAMKKTATLLLIERVIGPPNSDPSGAFSDLNMLVMPGGRERTREEFSDLLDSAGFRLTGIVPTQAGVSVIEAVPTE